MVAQSENVVFLTPFRYCQEEFLMPDAPLKAAVHSQMVAAMKSGDKARTQVLRMVLSEIKAREADDVNANPQQAVTGYANKLKKALADMEKLGQPEHAAQLRAELVIVEEFLPKAMDDAALEMLASEALAALGPLTKKDQGRAIGAVMKAVAAAGASADAGKVRGLVESKIGP
jgi:uncharacterized protein YqeY